MTRQEQGAGEKGQGLGGRNKGVGGRGNLITIKREVQEMTGGTFENLEIWKEAVDLAARVYECFRGCRDYEFRRQIQAAAVSVSSNIAEGYERDSNADFIRFLFIAKGSCGEVRSQMYLAARVGLLEQSVADAIVTDSIRLSKRIMRYIQIRRERFSVPREQTTR